MKPGTLLTTGILALLAVDVTGGPAPAEWGAALARYTGLGFRHIIPQGLDHVCFVLGLFLVSRNLLSLFWQVTVFTLSHSLTFGLALSGLIAVPEHAVEVAVALSIAFIAVENIVARDLGRWRPAMVFAFGLIHGLAFAHTFREHAVPAELFAPALVAFNVGIELGQLAVVGAACAVLGSFWQRSWYRAAVTIPASSVIAAAGLFWMIARWAH